MLRARTGLVGATLVLGVVFGGSAAPGRLLILLPELSGVALLALELSRRVASPAELWRRQAAAFLLALPFIQLIPLPPQIWSALPGRGTVSDAFSAAGIERPWEPLSLTPGATESFAFALLPAFAVFLSVSSLPRVERSILLALIVGLGIVSVALGLVQVGSGPDSTLRFYATASRSDAVGFFANRNHYAAFLYTVIALTPALLLRPTDGRAGRKAGTAFCVVLVLMVGVTMSGSRAGLVLGFLASMSAVAAGLRLTPGGLRPRLRWLVGLAAASLLLVTFGLADVLLRVRSDSIIDDLRWQIARTSLQTAEALFPFGSGFASFSAVYQMFETADQLIPAIVNNAHDDWIELVVESGAPALLVELAALLYLVGSSLRPQRGGPEGAATLLALWLLSLHSIVDYPLRTMAVNVALALACGLRTACPTNPHAPCSPAGTLPGSRWGGGLPASASRSLPPVGAEGHSSC